MTDVSFPSMGSTTRLIGLPAAGASRARSYLERYAERLSRFREDSELSRLNADPREIVPASDLLCAAVRAAVWAARRTNGLIDPTILPALRRGGYGSSLAGRAAESLTLALAAAPERRPASPSPEARWREVEVNSATGSVRRPPGVELDNGGTGKGLAADALAHRLRDHDRFLIDCGGDIRIGGAGASAQPFEIEVEHPLTGSCARTLRLAGGGVATSGLGRRLWRRPGGGFGHHLLDPATGDPAWTGLIAATALAPTALEAEVLAKAALLSGPAGGALLLERHGGILFRDGGELECVGPLAERERLVVRMPLATAV